MSYGLYRPVRLRGRRQAVMFVFAAYHVNCCKQAQVMDDHGVHLIVNPDDIIEIPRAPMTLDEGYYNWSGQRKPLKGWQRYAALKVAADRYLALSTDERLSLRPRHSSNACSDPDPDFRRRFGYAYPITPGRAADVQT